MIFVLLAMPFLVLVFSILVLTNTGRNFKEKLTVFLYNPEDAGKGSSGLMTALRIGFWISLFLCIWILSGIIRHRG